MYTFKYARGAIQLLEYFFDLLIYFYKQHFYKQPQAEIGKGQAKAKLQPEGELLLFENYSLSSSTLSSRNNGRYSKKCTKTISLFKWSYVISNNENEAENKK